MHRVHYIDRRSSLRWHCAARPQGTRLISPAAPKRPLGKTRKRRAPSGAKRMFTYYATAHFLLISRKPAVKGLLFFLTSAGVIETGRKASLGSPFVACRSCV